MPRTYEGKDGATRVSLEVTAEEIEFLLRAYAAGGQSYPQQGYQSNQQGYNRNYPPQDYQSAGRRQFLRFPSENSWQDGRGSSLRVTVSRQILLIPHTAPQCNSWLY
ncbi:MAG: hypothetical protein V8Q89_00810 [Christensenellales bacterium]